MADKYTQNVRGCARCKGDHDDVEFKPFVRPIKSGYVARTLVVLTLEATHWAACPTTGDPILLTFVDTDVSEEE